MSRLTRRYIQNDERTVYGEKDVSVYEILKKLAHYEDLEEQLEKLFGGKLPLDKVVETLKRTVQNGEEKLDYARILTNTEAEKWDKWKDLEEQGRLTVQAHGQWYPMHFGGVWQCSECRYLTKDNKATSYCPNCGAKMEA